MPRHPEDQSWPFRIKWWFMARTQDYPAGHVRFADVESWNGQMYDKGWVIHVLSMDVLVRQHWVDIQKKPGQYVTMPDGRSLEIPYAVLDGDADALLRPQAGVSPVSINTHDGGTITIWPSPDRSPVDIVTRDGTKIRSCPREWWEELLVRHIQRRKAEPPVTLDMGNGVTLQESYEWFDALCKDFMRRRADLVAVGWWPELMIRESVSDASNPGPLPVNGRPNALGEGANVVTPGDAKISAHSMMTENQEFV